MRLINLLAGIAISTTVHVALFLPTATSTESPPNAREARPRPAPPVIAAAVATETESPSAPEEPDPPEERPPEERPPEEDAPAEEEPVPEESPPEPEPDPVAEPEPEPQPPDPPEPAPLAQINEPEEAPQTTLPPLHLAQEHDGGVADTLTTLEGSDGAVADAPAAPQLVLRWDGPEHLLAVARSQGLRVVAVRDDGEIAGEVKNPESGLTPFDARVSSFSNRVRALPAHFFADVKTGAIPIREYWVLVPIGVDRRLSKMTTTAAREKGHSPSDVRAVHAHFAPTDGGGFALRVHSVEVR